MKKVAMMALALMTLGAMAGDPRVENVRARQIPDTKDVEVIYDLIAPDGGLFNVSATFNAPGVALAPKSVTGNFGQMSRRVATGGLCGTRARIGQTTSTATLCAPSAPESREMVLAARAAYSCGRADPIGLSAM